jgi:hypothetical protein
MALLVSVPWLFGAAAASAGAGFTLLTYSKDGDIKLRRERSRTFSAPEFSTRDQAWERLTALANANATEVSWNTSLFVALVSSLVFLGLAGYLRAAPPSASNTGMAWLIALFSVFALQDVVNRWKQAHRRNASAQESVDIIERLRWRTQ